LKQKHKNQGSRMWSDRFKPIANPYATPGTSGRSNGWKTKENRMVNESLPRVEEVTANEMEEDKTISLMSSRQSTEEGRSYGR
jgi:hypothetical protein